MTAPLRTSVDVTKINGPYPLLALFLVIVEGMLLFWLWRAESTTERVVAGLLMVVILALFLVAFMWMGREPQQQPIEAPGLGPMEPANVDVSVGEVAAPHQDELAGPDYVIGKPPDDWTVARITAREAIATNLGVSDPAAIEALLGSVDESEVVELRSPSSITVVPIPGQTLVDGQKFPTALAIALPVRLQVVALERAQPPLYIERPLEHNFLVNLAVLMRSPNMTLRAEPKLTGSASGRRRLTAVLSQHVEHSIVNGQPDRDVDIYVTLIGIEGDVRDHLLMLFYGSIVGQDDSRLAEDASTLERLVGSFRSLKVLDPDGERSATKEYARAKVEEFIQLNGEQLFWTEFSVVGARLVGLDMLDSQERAAAIEQLKPFELLDDQLGLEDEDLDELWAAMHEAEKGDATRFKELVGEMVAGILAADEEAEATDESIEVDGEEDRGDPEPA